MKLTGESLLVKREDLRWEVSPEGARILDPCEAKIYHLNASACRIWESLDGSASLKAIAAGLSREYEIPLVQAERDVLALAKQLLKDDLITEKKGAFTESGRR